HSRNRCHHLGAPRCFLKTQRSMARAVPGVPQPVRSAGFVLRGRREETKMNEPGGADPDIQYAYKASLLGAPWVLRLEPDALHWTGGGVSGRIPYAEIRQIRLAFRPVTMQSYRFLTEIWSERSPKIPIA